MQPILFRVDENGQLVIVAGERRFRASQIAKLASIPGMRVEQNFEVIAVIENIHREVLTALEEAEALKRVLEKDGLEQKDLARLLGKAESTVSEMIRPTTLPDKIKDKISADRKWTRQALLEVARENDRKKQLQVFKSLEKKLSSKVVFVGRQRKPKVEVIARQIVDLVRTLDPIEKNQSKLTPADIEGLLPQLKVIREKIDSIIGRNDVS